MIHHFLYSKMDMISQILKVKHKIAINYKENVMVISTNLIPLMLQHLVQDLRMRLRLLLSLPTKTKNQGLSQVAKGMEDSTITQIKCTKLLIEAGVKFE